MNIGFDAKRFFHNATGLGNYSRTLVQGLAQFYPEHQYFLFNPKRSKAYQKPPYNNVYEVLPQDFLSKKLTSLWRTNLVKKDIIKNDIRLYHGLSHEIPMGINSTSVKTVVTIHDLIFERYPEQYKKLDVHIYRYKFRNACKHANRIIAISNQTKTDLIDLYKIDGNKIDVCYQSCHPAFSKTISEVEKDFFRSTIGLPDQFFLYVGSIIERKNLLSVCKALHAINEKVEIPLVVIGKGRNYKQKVKEFITENGLLNKVIFLSKNSTFNSLQTPETMAAIYAMATALIYPSLYEGFGIPVLEALNSGVPVITSNVSCLPETAGNAALYVHPLNSDELAEAMERIFADEDLRADLIKKGREQAQKFNLKKCTDTVMDVYKKVLESV